MGGSMFGRDIFEELEREFMGAFENMNGRGGLNGRFMDEDGERYQYRQGGGMFGDPHNH